MSRIITPPDTDFGSHHKILVINAKSSDVELLALALKTIFVDVDVYLYCDDYACPEWALTVASQSGAVFKFPDTTIQKVIGYIQDLNGTE